MKILFVYTSLPKGGIETFFVRIVKQLFEEGYEIRFLFFGNVFDKELITELEKFAKIFKINNYLLIPSILKNKTPLLKLLMPVKRQKVQNEILEGVTHIHAPDFNSILYVNKILNFKEKINISTGVYHINEYNFTNSNKWYFKKTVDKFINYLPYQNILFFNEICKDFYYDKFNHKFENSLVTPIGIELPLTESSVLAKQNNEIVSIGRLTQWKKYNLHMIEVVKSLKDKNIIVHYDSYGDGPQLEVLNKKVKEYHLQDLVKFHGNIPYSKFKHIISNKLMFIGAGTALIEASSLGIPSLIGIENESEPVSYGFLHNTNTYSYQEKQLNFPRKKIEDFILYLIGLSKESYKIECEKAKERAKDFSIETTKKDFITLINSSQSSKFHLNQYQLARVVLSMFVNKVFFPKSNYSKRL